MTNRGLKIMAVLALMSLTACAHTVKEQEFSFQPEPVMDEYFPDAEELARQEEARRQTEKISRMRSAGQDSVIRKTKRFKDSIANNNCRGAEREARRLWETYSSSNNEMESDMLTAVCICHLQVDGDIDRFSRCAEELAEMTSQQRFLDRETQVVLELQPYFDQKQTAGRDPRIDTFITRGVQNSFGQTN